MARNSSALSVYLVAAGFRPPLPPPESFSRCTGERLWIHVADPAAAEALPTLLARLSDARGAAVEAVMSGSVARAHAIGAATVALPRERAADIRAALAIDPPGAALFLGFENAPAFLYGLREAGTRTLLVVGPAGLDVSTTGRLISRTALRLFDRILATTEAAAARLAKLGAAPGRVDMIGRLEVTDPPPPADPRALDKLTTMLAGRPAWLAAGIALDEIRPVLEAQRQANGLSHRLLLVLAPHDPADAAALTAAAEARGYTVARRSEGGAPDEEVQVLIADLPGERGLWYRVAPITFMGRSLVVARDDARPDTRPDAPAALGSAILYGPEVGLHRSSFDRLASLGGARLVHDGKSLGTALSSLLSPDRTAAMAHAAWAETSLGAEGTDRLVDILMTAYDDPASL